MKSFRLTAHGVCCSVDIEKEVGGKETFEGNQSSATNLREEIVGTDECSEVSRPCLRKLAI